MIKFEEHDGMLFRMLEEPVLLTPDAEMPCLVRLIQDDSRMGMFNRDTKPSRLSDFYLVARIVSNNIVVDEFMESDYNRFEIIGYPVAEGSAEWALYQMMQGKKVRHKSYSMPNVHCAMNEKRQIAIFTTPSSMIDGGDVICHANTWLAFRQVGTMIDERTGWEIYKEPEQPKPLLTEAKVGDLCQRRDGKWVQIDRLCSIGGLPWICYEIGGIRYTNNGEQLNSKLSELGIISTEPLAPEGTAEWAWQMLMLQKPVSHPAEGEFQDTYYTKEGFVRCMAKTGWQIYEPKQKPQYQVGDWVEWCGDQYMIESAPPQSGSRYDIRSPYDELGCSVCPENITRKLKPSEIVVRIGCLSGTVVHSVSEDCFLLARVNDPQHRACCIDMSMLDTPTRELVEGLLKDMQKQEEEK